MGDRIATLVIVKLVGSASGDSIIIAPGECITSATQNIPTATKAHSELVRALQDFADFRQSFRRISGWESASGVAPSMPSTPSF